MPKKIEETIHILCQSRGYLAPAKIMGPIVRPLLVAKSVAVQLLMIGAEVYEYVPKTKQTIKLTLTNINNPDRYKVVAKPTEETSVTPVMKMGVPKVAPMVEEETQVVAEPVEEIAAVEVSETSDVEEVKEVEETVAAPADTDESTSPEDITFTYNEDGTVDESTIVWSNYTKNQRKAIRARINEHNATITTK